MQKVLYSLSLISYCRTYAVFIYNKILDSLYHANLFSLRLTLLDAHRPMYISTENCRVGLTNDKNVRNHV
jgi:hypothetical protein